MRIASRLNLMVFVLVLVALALPGSLVMAQGDDEGDPEFALEFEFTGEITEISDEAIVVLVTGSAEDEDGIEFFLAPSGSFNPSQLEVGDVVRFNGVLLNDDTIKVSELEIVEEADDAEGDTGEQDQEQDQEQEQEQDQEGVCDKEDHPVIVGLADSYGIEAEVVAGYFCDGNGVGEVARALELAYQTGMDVEEIFAMRESGIGWGDILKELEVSPSSLAPGQVRKIEHGDGEQEQESEGPGNSSNAPGQQMHEGGEGPGNSSNAPGQQKQDGGEGPGNSSNAPGQQKKK